MPLDIIENEPHDNRVAVKREKEKVSSSSSSSNPVSRIFYLHITRRLFGTKPLEVLPLHHETYSRFRHLSVHFDTEKERRKNEKKTLFT